MIQFGNEKVQSGIQEQGDVGTETGILRPVPTGKGFPSMKATIYHEGSFRLSPKDFGQFATGFQNQRF